MKRMILTCAMLALVAACETKTAAGPADETATDAAAPAPAEVTSPAPAETPEPQTVPQPAPAETPVAVPDPAGQEPASDAAAPEAPIEVDWAHMPDSDEWTALAVAAIGDIGGPMMSTVPSDIDAFCPAYEGLDEAGRKAFWVSLLSAMARFESGFDPSVSFDERAHCPTCEWALTRDGRNVVSRGLLQLSQESANAYRGCKVPVADEESLHEPALNLRCGVAIINRLVSRDGVISAKPGQWKGGAAYWSVLRPGKLEKIQDFTSGTANCQP